MELSASARALIVPAMAAAALWGAAAATGAALYIDSGSWLDNSSFVALPRPDQGTVTFRVILTRNLWVLGLNLAGVGSLGITTIASVVANGLQAGLALAQASRAGVDLRALAAVTAPHSLELVALWVSAAVGFLGPRMVL